MLYPFLVAGLDHGQGVKAVTSPFDGRLIAQAPVADAAAVETALSAAYRLHRDRDGWLPLRERIEILKRAADIMAARAETLALQAAQEGGKPLVDSRVEIARAIDGLHHCVAVMREAGGEVIPMNLNAASAARMATTCREPIGVVVAVSAFNHPVNLIVHQVAPAVAAGCPFIVKPAGLTPLSCWHVVQILHEAGLPEAWGQVVLTDDREVATALVSDPRVGFFSFIGSPGVGWMLRAKLAPGARCALEHGGAAPVIVAEDADVDDMIPLLAKGGFYHAGQVCVSVQRVFAPNALAAEIAERIGAYGGAMTVGDPTLASTAIGPLIQPGEVDRVAQWVADAVAAGATCVAGGQRIGERCYAPTVLLNPPPTAQVSRAEIFGPVICVYGYDDIDEAIERANALDFAFQAAVFSKHLDVALRAYRRLDASAVMINDHTAFRVDWMPFAGLRQSGYGVGGIPHTIRDMQIEKMMVLRSAELDG